MDTVKGLVCRLHPHHLNTSVEKQLCCTLLKSWQGFLLCFSTSACFSANLLNLVSQLSSHCILSLLSALSFHLGSCCAFPHQLLELASLFLHMDFSLHYCACSFCISYNCFAIDVFHWFHPICWSHITSKFWLTPPILFS